MTGSESLAARVALGCMAAVASVALVRWKRLRTLPQGRFDAALFAAFAASRLGLFGVVFLVFGMAPRGDVQAYYWAQAQQVLGHLLPYRDFVSSYAPLHPYLDAALIAVWKTPLAIMLFSVLAECVLLPLWMRAGREFLAESELRVAALLYLASPVSLQFVAIDGQDNVVIALLIAAAVLLVLRSRVAAAGAAFGVSVAAVKFLPLLYAPGFVLAASKRWRFLAGGAAVCGVVYGGFLLAGAPVLGPLAAEGDLRSAGNLPYVVEAVFGVALPGRVTDGLLLAAVAGILTVMWQAGRWLDLQGRMRVLTFGMAALTLALLLLSKKSWPPYLMMALFPVCLTVGGGVRRLAGFAVFGVVAVAEHSYWANTLAQINSVGFHRSLFAGESGAVLMMLLELLLIAGYSWLLGEAVSRILKSAGPEGL